MLWYSNILMQRFYYGRYGIVIVCGLVFFYMLPALVGHRRGVNSSGLLMLLNLLLGWTVVVWFVLLIWAVAGQTKAADRYYRSLAAKSDA